MQKSTIIHIHTDLKFIHSVNSFDTEEFENIIIVIGNRGNFKGLYEDIVQYYDHSRTDFLKIIKLCKTANMVILYDLNFAKAYIANRLPKSVIIGWRFFGWELYIRIPEYVHSDRTLKILPKANDQKLYLKLKQRLKKYLIRVKYWTVPTNEIDRATFNRTDFLLGISKSEYDFLKTSWPNIPPFLQLNFPPYLEINISKKKEN